MYEVKVLNRSTFAVTETFTADGGDGDVRLKATVEEVNWVLNEPGSFRIRVPLFHPSATAIQCLLVEVQVWRDGVLIHWGVPLQRTLDGHSVVWTCPGILWYLTQRFAGPISIEHLLNPRFSADLTGWSAVGCTASHATNIRIRGPGTARLVSTSVSDNYLEQTFTVSTAVQGLFVALAGWYWIDPATPYVAGAFEERGLYISAPNSNGALGLWEPLNMAAAVGVPTRIETGIQIDPNRTNQVVTVRLYSPNGAIQWGAVSASVQESISNFPLGGDVTEMMQRVVVYAQTGLGKSNLNILTSTPASGVTEIVAYQFYDLPNIFNILKSYADRDLADFEIVFTSAASRTFTTFAPRKGSLKAYTVTVPGASTLTLQHDLDGQQTSTKTIRRGAGDGSDREIGVASNTAPLNGLVLESVSDAPTEINIDGLDAYAASDLVRLSAPVSVPSVTVPAADVLGLVVVGDTIAVNINWGAVQDVVSRRVVSMRLVPGAETVELGLNPI